VREEGAGDAAVGCGVQAAWVSAAGGRGRDGGAYPANREHELPVPVSELGRGVFWSGGTAMLLRITALWVSGMWGRSLARLAALLDIDVIKVC
jgi:hypothetical protein